MDIFTNFFTGSQDLGPIDILINVVLSGLMSYLVYLVYIKFGTALSNRKQFGGSFLLITVCTSLIIALIKSSIALSLGLVGALSIIRFRTAIKEPQELTYIFLCIAVGLGFGANERLITLSAGLLILFILVIIGLARKKKIEEVYNISIRTKSVALDKLIGIVGTYCRRVDLRRFDQNKEMLNALLFVEFDGYEKLNACIDALHKNDQDIEINFISNRSLG